MLIPPVAAPPPVFSAFVWDTSNESPTLALYDKAIHLQIKAKYKWQLLRRISNQKWY